MGLAQSYQPKEQSKKFSIWELDILKKICFWVGHFEICFWKKKLFLLHPYENQSKLLKYQGWIEILMITLVIARNNLLYSV